PFLNGAYSVVLDDKLIFNEVFRRHSGLLPETYALLRRGMVLPLTAGRAACRQGAPPPPGGEGAAAGPTPTGGGGRPRGIPVERRGEGVPGASWNGERLPAERVRERLRSSKDRLVMEFVEQARYAREIHPGSTNTIRILCLWNDDEKEPFVARAVHRFGSPTT